MPSTPGRPGPPGDPSRPTNWPRPCHSFTTPPATHRRWPWGSVTSTRHGGSSYSNPSACSWCNTECLSTFTVVMISSTQDPTWASTSESSPLPDACPSAATGVAGLAESRRDTVSGQEREVHRWIAGAYYPWAPSRWQLSRSRPLTALISSGVWGVIDVAGKGFELRRGRVLLSPRAMCLT